MIISELIAYGAKLFGVTYADVISDKRNTRYTRPRFAIYKALSNRGHSAGRISEWLTHDKAGVLTGLRRADEILKEDPQFAFRVDAITKAKMKNGKVSSPHDVLEFIATYTGRTSGEVCEHTRTHNHQRIVAVAAHIMSQMGYTTTEISKVFNQKGSWTRERMAKFDETWLDDNIALVLLEAAWQEFIGDGTICSTI